MACKIESLVNEQFTSLDGSASVQQGAALMAEKGVGAIVVTNNDSLVGLFTERDLLNRVVAAGRDLAQTSLSEVCSRDLIAIEHHYSCEEAAKKMEINGCRRMLVNRDGELMGIVNLRRIAHELARQGAGRNRFADLFVVLTVAASLAVIGLLLYQLPAMLRVAERVS